MNYQSVAFQRRPMLGQPPGLVRINSRYVVSVAPYQKPTDQVTDTTILLATGDSVVVQHTPTDVDRRLKGGS